MKSIKVRKFEEFINESYVDLSHVFLRFPMLVNVVYPSGEGALAKTIAEVRNQLFEQQLLDGSNYNTIPIPAGVPVINFTENNKLVRLMIDEGLLKRECVYNSPDASDLVSDKIIFHKTFMGSPYLPQTGFSIDEVAEMKFPIIAKPAKGRSAEGIKKFDTVEELNNSTDKFDVFSEMIDIAKEYRCFCFRNIIMDLNCRVKVEDSEDFLKDTSTKTDFFYDTVDVDSYEKRSQLEELLKHCRDRVNLDFFSVDFAEDASGKLWVIEMNSRTGMGPDKMVKLYTMIYKDFYGEESMNLNDKATLDRISEDWKKLYVNKKGVVNECVSVSGFLDGSSFLFKNRDRSYTPDSRVVREKVGDVEIVYYTDQSGWMEGMNSNGVGFVFNQLTVKQWEGYGHSYIVTDDPKPKTRRLAKSEWFKGFLEDVRKVLTSETAEEAIEKLTKAGKFGSYLVGDKEKIYELEIFNGKSEKVLRNKADEDLGFYVKTNHGVLFPEAGHQPTGDSVKRATSSIRKYQALTHLQGVKSLEDVSHRMKFQAFEPNSSLNVFRTDDEEHTISQCMMDLTNLKFTFYHDSNTADSVTVEDENFSNPVIKIEIRRYVA